MHHFIVSLYSTFLFTGILYVLAWIRYQYRLTLWQVVEFFVLYYVVHVLFSYYFQPDEIVTADMFTNRDMFPTWVVW